MKTIVCVSDALTPKQKVWKKYSEKNRDKINAKARESYAKDSSKRLEASAKWRAENPNADREKQYKRKYNLTLNEYDEMFANQKGLCAICNKKETIHSRNASNPMWLAVDHNHVTGKVRGLLCFRCNTTLHYFEKNKEAIINIENYLRRNK